MSTAVVEERLLDDARGGGEHNADKPVALTKHRRVSDGWRILICLLLIFAGAGGAYLSCIHTTLWVQNMTAGRGWIAVALVVFAAWKPWRLMLGAYLFGGVTILQFHAQALGLALPVQLLSALPYLATIVVLVLMSRDPRILQRHFPALLGKRYVG